MIFLMIFTAFLTEVLGSRRNQYWVGMIFMMIFMIYMMIFTAFLTEVLGSRRNQYWVGMKMLEISKEFAWVDNSPVDYVNWARGEPNGGDSVSEAIR